MPRFNLFWLSVYLGVVFVKGLNLLFRNFYAPFKTFGINLKIGHTDFFRHPVLFFVFLKVFLQFGFFDLHGFLEIFRSEFNKRNFDLFVGEGVVLQDFQVSDVQKGKKKLLELFIQQFRR